EERSDRGSDHRERVGNSSGLHQFPGVGGEKSFLSHRNRSVRAEMRVVSGEKANAVQPSTAPSQGAFSLPATDMLFRPNQEISLRARNHHCSPAGPRSTRQFAAVPTPPRKNLQALATPFSRRLGGKVKKHKWLG